MQSKKRTIELANLVVLFGKKGLVESFKKDFFPVVRDGRVKGRGEVRAYQFHNLKVASIDKTPVLYGRLLKFMDIEAEQDYDESQSKLIDSSSKMASVPSSFFMIDLTTHRVSYLGETRRAPSLSNFEYCLKKLLTTEWTRERRKLKKRLLAEKGRKRLNKKFKEEIERKLNEQMPIPDVRVTPLPAIRKLGKTLDGFQTITQVNIKPLLRNNELSNENANFLRSLEQQQDRLKSKNTSLNVSNSDGLKKPEVKKLVKAASSGNYDIKVKGKDASGEDIDSNLKEVSVKFKELVPARESEELRAKRLLGKLINAFDRGYILAVETTENVLREARDIVSEFKD